MHILIFDECEAIFRVRGENDGSAASKSYDSVVNALLTKMDGLTEIDNIVVIGLTNRKELLDPALLRPGRFEVQIEIGLPNAQDRHKIFEIHTKQMQATGVLAEDVNIQMLAEEAPRISGAEIAGVVRNAASYAVDRLIKQAAVQDQVEMTNDVNSENLPKMQIGFIDFIGMPVHVSLAKHVPELECLLETVEENRRALGKPASWEVQDVGERHKEKQRKLREQRAPEELDDQRAEQPRKFTQAHLQRHTQRARVRCHQEWQRVRYAVSSPHVQPCSWRCEPHAAP